MRRLLPASALCATLALQPAPAGAEGKKILAVFDLELSGLALSAKKAGVLDDYLHRKLASGRRFSVVPRAEVRKRLRRAKAESYKECYDQSCQIEIGKELAAEQTVSAKILKVGDECLVSLLVYDLRTAASAGASEATGACSLSALIRSVESAALALEGPAPAAAPPRAGVEDPQRCPEPGTRRMGAPPPKGRVYWCVDEKNRRHGPLVSFHTNGEVSLRETYVEGLAQGTRTTFHDNGQPSERGQMKDNLRTGEWTRWSRQGGEIEKGPYVKGLQEGDWTRFHGRLGYVTEVARYVKGRRAGPAVEKREGGEVRAKGAYRDDERHGTWQYYRDGRLQSTAEYRAGAKEGPMVYVDADGAPTSEYTYRADRRDGPARFWRTQEGQRFLSKETAYVAGKEEGLRKIFTAQGATKSEVTYEAGKPHGPAVFFGETRDGVRYKAREGSHRRGKKHGRWRTWSGPDRLRDETTYADGKKHGPYVRYSVATGQRSEAGTYDGGRRHGWFTYYDRAGQRTRRVRFARGRRVETEK